MAETPKMDPHHESKDLQAWLRGNDDQSATVHRKRKKITTKQLQGYKKLKRAKGGVSELKQVLSHWTQPTRCLYVMGPVSLSCQGVTYKRMEQLFGQFGTLTGLNMGFNTPHVFVSYAKVASAVAARKALHWKPFPAPTNQEENPHAPYIFLDYALAEEDIEEGAKLTSALSSPPVLQTSQVTGFDWQWPTGEEEDVKGKSKSKTGRIYTDAKVPGLVLIPDIVSVEEETRILEFCATQEFDLYNNRHVLHYGEHQDEKPMPAAFSFLIERLETLLPGASSADYPDLQLCRSNHTPQLRTCIRSALQEVLTALASPGNSSSSSSCSEIIETITDLVTSYVSAVEDPTSSRTHIQGFKPDQMHVNKYFSGGGIPPHVDCHSAFSDCVVSVSLQSPIVMEFREYGKLTDIGYPDKMIQQQNIVLPARSAVVLTGAARYKWTHGIATRRHDCINGRMIPRNERVSLTFRKVLPKRICLCSFPEYCDTPLSLRETKLTLQEDSASSEHPYGHGIMGKHRYLGHDDNGER